MKRELYKVDYKNYKRIIIPLDGVELKVLPVNTNVMSFKEAIMWNVACLGRIKAYCIFNGEKLVHRSLVVRGKAKFPFLEEGDIEIGPCWTDEAYRGRGYYPYTISKIIESEIQNGDGTAYMIVNSQNISSQHGIEKIGFQKTGMIVVKDSFKRQIAIKDKGKGQDT